MSDDMVITAEDVEQLEPAVRKVRDGYVELRYPADSDTPDAIGQVRERHADVYIEAGFRPLTESEG